MTVVDRARAIALVIAASSASWSVAQAQSVEAEALFREGRALIKVGKLAAGCDKLAASERYESSVGTLLNLGDCREKLGKLASAWAAFRKAEAIARRTTGDDRRQAEAARRAALLEPRLPSLIVEVAQRVDGLVVRRDGQLIDEAVWGTPLPVDPGTYAITAEAPGYAAWRTTVVVGDGATRQVVAVPRLPAAGTSPSGVAPTVVEIQRPPLVVRRGVWSATRVLSAGLGLAGAGALGTGIYFGVHARTLEDRADRRCPTAACDDPDGLRLNHQAQTSASRANVLYVAGGAALASAAVLWIFGRPGEIVVAPAAGDHQLGVAMAGRF